VIYTQQHSLYGLAGLFLLDLTLEWDRVCIIRWFEIRLGLREHDRS